MIITPHLGIELTQRCNLDCKHCFRGNSHNLNISREIIERVFDKVKYVGTLDLSGGEVFLAYEELKMVLEVAKEKKCIIETCSMLINGTIYDQRIYDLLNEYFNNNYQIGISYDDFHDKSIERIYKNTLKSSNNPDLNPCNLKEVKENMKRHMFNMHYIGFRRVSNHLIENGRAISVDTPKKKFEALGYYYSESINNFLLVGPMIFIGADGYISDINSDISKRNEQSIGNVLDSTISDCVKNAGIKKDCNSVKDFFEMMFQREQDFATHQGDHLIFMNNKMSFTDYVPDTKYAKEVARIEDMIKKISTINNFEDFHKYVSSIDFSDYPYDLSQIDHSNILKK